MATNKIVKKNPAARKKIVSKKPPADKKMSKSAPKPPPNHLRFVKRYPLLGEAWELIGRAGREGPLDEKSVRLIKLAVAMGAMREGAVHSNVRRALAEGLNREEVEQVLALAAGTLGMSATAAVFTWVGDILS